MRLKLSVRVCLLGIWNGVWTTRVSNFNFNSSGPLCVCHEYLNDKGFLNESSVCVAITIARIRASAFMPHGGLFRESAFYLFGGILVHVPNGRTLAQMETNSSCEDIKEEV